MPLRLALVALLLVACGGRSQGEASQGQTSASALVSGAPAAAAATGVKPACPPTGLWTTCAAIERLDRAGLAPRADSGTVPEPPLGIPGQRVRVGTSEVDLFIYEDAGARQRDAKKLERSRYVAYDAPIGMQVLPTLIESANLVAILRSRNDHLRERVADALTAGPPQPSKP